MGHLPVWRDKVCTEVTYGGASAAVAKQFSSALPRQIADAAQLQQDHRIRSEVNEKGTLQIKRGMDPIPNRTRQRLAGTHQRSRQNSAVHGRDSVRTSFPAIATVDMSEDV